MATRRGGKVHIPCGRPMKSYVDKRSEVEDLALDHPYNYNMAWRQIVRRGDACIWLVQYLREELYIAFEPQLIEERVRLYGGVASAAVPKVWDRQAN